MTELAWRSLRNFDRLDNADKWSGSIGRQSDFFAQPVSKADRWILNYERSDDFLLI